MFWEAEKLKKERETRTSEGEVQRNSWDSISPQRGDPSDDTEVPTDVSLFRAHSKQKAMQGSASKGFSSHPKIIVYPQWNACAQDISICIGTSSSFRQVLNNWLGWGTCLSKGMKVQGNKYRSQWETIRMKYLWDRISICLSIQKYYSLLVKALLFLFFNVKCILEAETRLQPFSPPDVDVPSAFIPPSSAPLFSSTSKLNNNVPHLTL